MTQSVPPTRKLKLGTWLSLAAGLLAACSFQKFDYLQDELDKPASAGSSGLGSGGDGVGNGGTDNLGGDGAGAENSGGTAGAGGKGGSGGSSSGGSSSGGSSSGGSSSGGSGNGGNGGMGAVGQIVNPSFETNTTMGWKVTPTEALAKRHAYTELANGVAAPDGAYKFTTWHLTEAFTVELTQVITGIEDGTYVFKGYFARGPGFNSVEVFARDCGGTDPTPVPVPLTEASAWLAINLTGIVVDGGSCEVGVRVDSNANNWLNADLFTFEKVVE